MSSPCREPTSKFRVLAAAAATVLLATCEREERRFREPPPAASTALGSVRLSDLQPGGATTAKEPENPYENNAYALSEGKRLYQWFNCSGCHFQGGGGIGPPLMDDEWIYGSSPVNVFATIVEGRPNGMPSFRGRIPEYQVWQIAAYVRSLSGLVPKDVTSARSDDMSAKPPETQTEPAVPQWGGKLP